MTTALVVGAGGREHALAWRLAQSPHVDTIICAPGNPGTATLGENRPLDTGDPAAVAALADRVDASLVVVGPEDPLVAGAAVAVRARGRACFGPSASAARLEGSKAWMKDVLVAAGVPTARHATFGADDEAAALAYLETFDGLWVVKTDGLAAGKGVVVTESIDEARATVRDYLSGAAFGAAGRTCVIEEGLTGPEVSFFALCDGTRAVPLACAQDHKRVGDGDSGPNTGGMGAYSPVPVAGTDLVDELMERAIGPTLAAMQQRGAPFTGVLFCGVMLTPAGPKVLEYNVRFGDPECQILMRRLHSDLYVHLLEAATGTLQTPVALSPDAAVAVVLAAANYPASPRRGDVITGLAAATHRPGVEVFHAGTRAIDGEVVTDGGRVLAVTATGADLATAVDRAYDGVAAIDFAGMHYRRDIAARGLNP